MWSARVFEAGDCQLAVKGCVVGYKYDDGVTKFTQEISTEQIRRYQQEGEDLILFVDGDIILAIDVCELDELVEFLDEFFEELESE